MYNSFFGFKEKPFNLTPDARYLFLSPHHKEALDHLSRCASNGGCPDLVITDVRMAEMSGEMFVENLRSILPHLPVIVISAFELPDQLGGYPFLRKPFKIREMIDSIEKTEKRGPEASGDVPT